MLGKPKTHCMMILASKPQQAQLRGFCQARIPRGPPRTAALPQVLDPPERPWYQTSFADLVPFLALPSLTAIRDLTDLVTQENV